MEITTSRLVLREYVPDDVPAFVAYQADPRSREFHGPGDGEPDGVRALVQRFTRWAAEDPRRNWQLAIALRDAPAALIGSVGLRTADQPPGVAEFGLELAPPYWGGGYATEAADALLTAGFTSLGLDVVRGVSVSANERVARLVRRLGFRHVGDEEEVGWMAERGWRSTTWEMTRERWLAGREGGEGRIAR